MKEQPVIRVRDLSKKYRIQHRLGHNANPTIKDEIVRLAKKPLAMLGAYHGVEREDFWALKNIGFDVYPGDVVGIMGRNGSGKSTLFQIMSRVVKPTAGHVEIVGTTSALLEVGTGFHNELTGRENVYFNGAVLGMKKTEIDSRFDEIVEFSEIEKFIDTPVKYYSSGMRVRLAFSVSAHLNPDVLLIDEVLAVGDVKFKQKSLKRMQKIADSGTTILFVSHIVSQIRNICNRGILLDEGKKVYDGNLDETIDEYLKLNEPTGSDTEELPKHDAMTTGELGLENVQNTVSIKEGLPQLKITFDIVNLTGKYFKNIRFAFMITDALGKNITLVNNNIINKHIDISAKNKRSSFIYTIPGLNLIPDTYKLRATISDNENPTNIYLKEVSGMKFIIPDYSWGNILMSNTNPSASSIIYRYTLDKIDG